MYPGVPDHMTLEITAGAGLVAARVAVVAAALVARTLRPGPRPSVAVRQQWLEGGIGGL